MQKTSILISIVMPVIRIDSYFIEALDSLKSQTFVAFELICVLDGCSFTEALKVIESYDCYFKIKIINLKTHCGAAVARNVGLDKAIGEYVIFLDSDDLFETDMLQSLYKQITKENDDICICNFKILSKGSDNGKLCYREIIDKSNEDWMLLVHTNPWTKLCKRKYLIDNTIYFQDITCNNDVAFSILCYAFTDKISYVEDALVNYRIVNDGRISNDRDIRNNYFAYEYLYDFFYEKRKFCKETLLALAFSALREFETYKYPSLSKECYLMTQEFLEKNIVETRYEDSFYDGLLHEYIENDFESKWWLDYLSFENQLEFHWDTIYTLIKGKEFGIWGMGERGRAFDSICKKHGVNVKYVTDINKVNDIRYMKSNCFLENVDMIIASNKSIYDFLINDFSSNKLINLQNFCRF